MSLPFPSTGGVSSPPQLSLDPRQVQAMDAPLIALTQQCNGDLRQLMHAFFSFLNRRTDFYLVPHPDDIGPEKDGGRRPAQMGFREGDAERLLLAAFRQFPLRRIPKGGVVPTGAAAAAATATGGTAAPPIPPTKATAPVPTVPPPASATAEADAGIKGRTPPQTDDAESEAVHNVQATHKNDGNDSYDSDDDSARNAASAAASATVATNLRGVRYSEKGLQIPVGNGGSTPRYKWTQTLEEATVLIGIPDSLRGRDFDVSLSPTRVSVRAKKPLPGEDSPRTFVEGTLVERIRSDESTWTVEGGVMILTLDKMKKTFWATVIEGDDKIDTDLVDSRRHIGDYDEATQGQLRKVIFDQNQYHRGLPNSDEILGTKPKIPELPPGVEYIDQKKLDEVSGQGK